MDGNSYTCELDQRTKSSLTIYLIKDVQNLEEIRSNVISGAWECSIIKPSLILDPFQVVVAANKAVLAQKYNSMTTKSVFTEILYSLSISKNITQSLSRFGVEKDPNILVCFLTDSKDQKKILSKIEGNICPISDLADFRDMKSIKSYYKLNNVEYEKESELVDLVISRIATKDFVSF